MHQRSCDLCDNTAVIHDTLIRGGVVKIRHLCRTHGLKMWREAIPPVDAPPAALKKDPVYQSLVADAAKILKGRGNTGPEQP